ncbi:MAG TPA: potassium channel protein [Thermodesulfobacteriota bacterium]|nr:potassium channel protein [Thermodesulfobacteriota bacterium]
MNELRNRLLIAATLLVFAVVFGTLGYMLVEGWNFLESFYMTIITLTTAGYREVHPLSDEGMVFTIILLVGGVGIILYTLTTGAGIIIEGQLKGVFWRKRLENKINELKGHYIVCGYGRMGRIISKELKGRGISFVVVEKHSGALQPGMEDILIFEGDATKDEVLTKVGIQRAKGLVTVLPTDAENLFVVLSARGLNPNLVIVARAVEEAAEGKILRAGANRVISPYYTGGLRMAQTILKPAVTDFIEFATKSGNLELQMEEIIVRDGSKFVGLTLYESGIGKDLGIIIVAIKKPDGSMQFNPTSRSVIQAGDTLIALGEIHKLNTLELLAHGS